MNAPILTRSTDLNTASATNGMAIAQDEWPEASRVAEWVDGMPETTVRNVSADALGGDPEDRGLQVRVGNVLRSLGYRVVELRHAQRRRVYVRAL